MTGQETEGLAARRLGGRVHTRVRGAAIVGMAIAGLALVIALLWTDIAFAGSASVVYRGSTERKQIALTFDDNTVVSRALATLRALQQNEVPATLFLIGSAVGSYPAINYEIGKGMMGGWFEVGDHTWSHPVLTKLSTAALASQIGGGTDAFHKATGARTVPLFRPPYGTTDSRVAAVAGSEGFRYLVLWDVDPRDWAGGSASAIADHVVAHAHNGAIVVMHLSAPNTAAAIPSIVSRLRAQGYEFVTVSTMLKGDRLFLDADTSTESGQAIARMVEEGFMSGYDGNYFGPGDAMTRVQVAKVATLVGGLHTPEVEKAGVAQLFRRTSVARRRRRSARLPLRFCRGSHCSRSGRGDPRPRRDAGLQSQRRDHSGAARSDPGPHGPGAQRLWVGVDGGADRKPRGGAIRRRGVGICRCSRVCGGRRRARRRARSGEGLL